jgi:fructosamine-3-kinase
MTELFGRFPAAFYEAYNAAFPLDEGYDKVRKTLYNLYHIIITSIYLEGLWVPS